MKNRIYSPVGISTQCARLITIFVVALSLIVTPVPISAQDNFTDAELDQLLGPIALYPDPLLAQVIPAATFVDQIQEADNLLGGNIDESVIDSQSWDVSVKSVAHYPQVLEMMSSEADWTTAVGQAYVNQSTDVGKSIQRLRAEAKNSGALVSGSQQTVVVERAAIKIVPAQPQVIYVPQYDPQVVYVKSGPSTGAVIAATAIAFGTGLAIGAWMNRDWDWWGRGPYYHGWVGGGWIGYSRPFIGRNTNIYINNNFNRINVNRNVFNRNITNFRADINNRTRINNRLDINRGNARDRNPNRPNRGGINDKRGLNRTALPNTPVNRPGNSANKAVNRPKTLPGKTVNRPGGNPSGNRTRPNNNAGSGARPAINKPAKPKPRNPGAQKTIPKRTAPARPRSLPRRRG